MRIPPTALITAGGGGSEGTKVAANLKSAGGRAAATTGCGLHGGQWRDVGDRGRDAAVTGSGRHGSGENDRRDYRESERRRPESVLHRHSSVLN